MRRFLALPLIITPKKSYGFFRGPQRGGGVGEGVCLLQNKKIAAARDRGGECCLKNCEGFFCYDLPERKQSRCLLQSFLMAHDGHRLVLLYPYPDTVRGPTLHKTLLSTVLTPRGLP